MKKQYSDNDSKFTYFQNRACRHCLAPIPDQEHATREFCQVTYDSGGNVRDCKTSYHREKDKPDRDFWADLVARHKGISTRIDFLVKKKGYSVSTQDLDTYDIFLTEAGSYTIKPDGKIITQFLKYTIHSNPFSNIHNISYNDK
jgi:hypothetical protein